MKFSGKVGDQVGGDPDPDGDTGKTRIGGGMHCPLCDGYTLLRSGVFRIRTSAGANDGGINMAGGWVTYDIAADAAGSADAPGRQATSCIHAAAPGR